MFYLILTVLELRGSYCVLRVLLKTGSTLWSDDVRTLSNAGWNSYVFMHVVMLELLVVFGVVLIICGVLLCFKVAAISELIKWRVKEELKGLQEEKVGY